GHLGAAAESDRDEHGVVDQMVVDDDRSGAPLELAGEGQLAHGRRALQEVQARLALLSAHSGGGSVRSVHPGTVARGPTRGLGKYVDHVSAAAYGVAMSTAQSWFEDNRANWDDRAALHEAAGYGIEELVRDPALITPEVAQDRGRLGDLAGLDVVHLQCHLGTDTVSLSRLGARRVVGVDLSPGSLRRARLLAERAGAAIEYVEANVYDAREAVEGAFDLVYTSLGVLCWLPDVTAWAQVVASLLRPGGRFLIRDDHPMFMTVGEDVSDGLRIEQPYFQRPEPMTWDEAGSYVQSPQDAPAFENGVNH